MEVLTRLLFLLMTLISWSVCQGQTVIKAETGQNITLPCKGSENNPVTFVKLTRPDLDPEYVLVYRDDRIDEHNQNPHFKGRIEMQSFSSSDGNVSVILYNVIKEDNGTYVCRVRCDTDGAKTRRKRAISERIIQLRVLSPGNEDEKDTLGNSRSHVPAACALMILIVAVAIITNKKMLMSSPPDKAISQMT